MAGVYERNHQWQDRVRVLRQPRTGERAGANRYGARAGERGGHEQRSDSALLTATYQSNSPALLERGGRQYPYALITNGGAFVGNPAAIPNTVSAHAGDSLTLWVTGLGSTNPAVPAGQQPVTFAAIGTMPTVTAGGQSVTVLGGVLRYAGLYQVNIQLPASLPTGDLLLKIIQGSFQSPDGVLINVQEYPRSGLGPLSVTSPLSLRVSRAGASRVHAPWSPRG